MQTSFLALFMLLAGLVAWHVAGVRRLNRELQDVLDERAEFEQGEQRLSEILAASPDLVGMADGDGRLLYLNPAGRALLGIAPDHDLSQMHMKDFHAPEFCLSLQKDWLPTALRRQVWSGESELLSRDGHHVPVSQAIIAHKGPSGEFRFFSTVARDISDRKRHERAIEDERGRLLSVLEEMPAYVCLVAPDGSVRYSNRYFGARFGKAGARSCSEFFGCEEAPCATCPGRRATGDHPHTWEWNPAPDGRIYEVHDFPFTDSDGSALVLEIGIDITERKRAEATLQESQRQLSHLAHHDSLTGLPNRLLFQDRLRHALAKAERNHETVALLFIDLDRFKPVNDLYGHEQGDALLREAARRLANAVRKSDTVARLGGDEFTVILDNLTHAASIVTLARKLLASLSQPFAIRGEPITISASIGVALFPRDADNDDTLIRLADIAMYRVKQAGRNGYQFYSLDSLPETLVQTRAPSSPDPPGCRASPVHFIRGFPE